MRSRRVFILLLFLSAGLTRAQAPSPTEPAQLMFRATTRLVQLSVIVQDSAGHPVSGLRKEDFSLIDNGARQEIRFFSLDSGSRNQASPAPPDPEVFSNAKERAGAVSGNLVAVLLDLLNTPRKDLTYARRQLARFLAKMDPGDTVAVYTLGQELRVIQEFTSDSSALVQRLSAGKGLPLDSVTSEEDPNTLGVFYTGDPVLATLHGLQSIAHHLTGLPGRKNLVWISTGIPGTLGFWEGQGESYVSAGTLNKDLSRMEGMGSELRQVVRSMNDADIAVYPVDARGLIATVTTGDNTNILTMQSLARWTGGRAFANGNDIAMGIHQAAADSRTSYRLGYYPQDLRGDNSFHRIAVKVAKPGLTVRHRTGYYDLAEPEQDEESRKTAVRVVLAGHLNATGLGVAARVRSFRKPEPGGLQVDVHVEPPGIRFVQQGALLHGKVDVVLVPMDERGHAYLGVFEPLQLRLTAVEYDRVMRAGIDYRRLMERPRNAKLLKVVVRDISTGTMGSVAIPLSRVREVK